MTMIAVKVYCSRGYKCKVNPIFTNNSDEMCACENLMFTLFWLKEYMLFRQVHEKVVFCVVLKLAYF